MLHSCLGTWNGGYERLFVASTLGLIGFLLWPALLANQLYTHIKHRKTSVPASNHAYICWKNLPFSQSLQSVSLSLFSSNANTFLRSRRSMTDRRCVALVLVVWLAVASATLGQRQTRSMHNNNLTRGSFPKGFVFGTTASAYQVNLPKHSSSIYDPCNMLTATFRVILGIR